MGDLKDQLKKAKLLSDKDAKRVAHEQRVERHEKGREGIAAEDARKREELQRMQEEQRLKTKEAQARLDAQRKESEARARVAEVIRTHVLRGTDGPRRFHFVARSGRVPFLSLSLESARGLEAGGLAIVEEPASAPESFVIVDRRIAAQVLEVAPELVRFLAGRT